MKYTVKPVIDQGCDCEDCKAGRRLYLLYRLPITTDSRWSAMSMQAYSSPEECKQKHRWGLNFGPNDTWEDGSPIVVPEPVRTAQPDEHGRVPLDAAAFSKSAQALARHWPE